MALQQESPAQKEARLERMREFCKQNPDTEGCDELLEEEVNTDAIVEVGQMGIIMSGLSSSMCLVIVVMMLMRKR